MDDARPLGRWAFALVGVLAATAGMAVGHLVAGLVLPEASPVLAVGSRVIDDTPESLKQWAIRRFGNDDKAVLIGSVVVVTLLLAVVAGVLSRRRPVIGLAFVGVLGTVVLAAAVTSSAVSASASTATVPGALVLPALAATVTAAATLLGLRRLALTPADAAPAPIEVTPSPEVSGGERLAEPAERHPESDDEAGPIESPTDHSAIGLAPVGATPRRRFLTGAAGAAAGSALFRRASASAWPGPNPYESSATSGSPPAPRACPRPSTARSPASPACRPRPPTSTGSTPRSSRPGIDRSRWHLTIDGDVDQRIELDFDDLLDLPLVERDITLNCVSNEVGGPYISSGRWIGVRTRDLLRRAGVANRADQILSRSSDGMTISTPIGALMDDRDAMIAVGLDGEALPRERGYPARLVTPGLYGYVGATKWLTSLTATTFAERKAYWTERGWAEQAPVKTQSRIDVPASFAKVPVGRVKIGGVAWAQRRGIRRVEVQVDDGPWQEAVLGPEVNIDYWRQWYLLAEIDTPGRHDLRVRAVDGDGETQTAERAAPFPNGASGHHSVSITAE